LNRKSTFGKRLRNLLLTILVLSATLFLLYRLFRYHQTRAGFPFDTTIAGIDVGGLSPDEAGQLLRDQYLAPVAIYHGQERIELNPADVGFNLEAEAMVARAQEAHAARNYWLGFATHLTGLSWQPIKVPLQAGYDPALLSEMLETIASYLDDPGAAAADPLGNGYVRRRQVWLCDGR
jgi:hypothetical protein